VGSYDYLLGDMKAAGVSVSADPSLFEVKRAVSELCILPLGSHVVHQRSAPFIRTVCLSGPAGSGKTMLSHAVATETGAVFFDVSPAVIRPKCTSLRTARLLLHMVFKVAKAMSPAVVYVDDAEKVFSRSKKKKSQKPKPVLRPGESGPQETTDTSEEKRKTLAEVALFLRKELSTQVSMLKQGNKILVIGNTRTPFTAALSLNTFFDRHLIVTRPDHITRAALWQSLITRTGGIITPALDLSVLAHISEGFTAGAIASVVAGTLMGNRIQMIEKKPLQGSEFAEPLAKLETVTAEYEEQLKKWLEKVPKPVLKKRIVDNEQPAKKKPAAKRPVVVTKYL